MAQTFVAEFPIDQLTEHPDNPRRGDTGMIEDSIEANGFYGAVVVQASTNRIIVGNHRTRVAAALGHQSVPALVLDVNDEQARRIMLADNRSNDVAGYDERGLAELLASLEDLSGTGFADRDLALLLAKLDMEEPEIEEPAETTVIPQRVEAGDLWQVGGHTLVCGDSRDPAVLDHLLAGVPINLAFTSPPYADRRKYDSSTEFRPIHPRDYVSWFEPVQANVKDHLAPDGAWIVNIRTAAQDDVDMETYVLDLVLAHVREWGWHWGDEYCWERVGMPKRAVCRFKHGYELIYLFAQGRWKFRPDNVRHYSSHVPQARGPGSGRSRYPFIQGALDGEAYVFDASHNEQADLAYPSNRLPTFMGERTQGHPAAFPVGLPKFFVQAYTDTGDIVLDPFAGSGSTLVAAAGTDRLGYGIELSPGYCDIILNRLEIATQYEAELVQRTASV